MDLSYIFKRETILVGIVMFVSLLNMLYLHHEKKMMIIQLWEGVKQPM